MTTQLQRAYGITPDRQAIPKGSEAKPEKRKASESKKGERADPFAGLPRRPLIRDREG